MTNEMIRKIIKEELKSIFIEVLSDDNYKQFVNDLIREFYRNIIQIDLESHNSRISILEKRIDESPHDKLINENNLFMEELAPYLNHVAKTEQQFFNKLKELEKKYGI
jgi:hypothetical protein